MIDDLNFALPGLQELSAPVSDAMIPVVLLTPHTQGDAWGIDHIGPCLNNVAGPVRQAVTAEIRFYKFSDQTAEPSLTAPAVIIDPDTWEFNVAEIEGEDFTLTPELWWWVIWETSGITDVIAAVGQLTVRHAPEV